jgi:LysM repeat protein
MTNQHGDFEPQVRASFLRHLGSLDPLIPNSSPMRGDTGPRRLDATRASGLPGIGIVAAGLLILVLAVFIAPALRPSGAGGSESPTAVESDAAPSPSTAADGSPLASTAALTAGSTAVPTSGASPAPSFLRYRVQAGNTLASIAARFGIQPWELQLANPTVDFGNLVVGQIINIPPTGFLTPPPAS